MQKHYNTIQQIRHINKTLRKMVKVNRSTRRRRTDVYYLRQLGRMLSLQIKLTDLMPPEWKR